MRLSRDKPLWFVDYRGRWFKVEVRAFDDKYVTVTSPTGLDAKHEAPFPWPDGLTIVRNSRTYKRLYPIEAGPR